MTPPNDYEPIALLDERVFMQEVANRLNTFLAIYPEESQNLFGTFIEYQHELVAVHNQLKEKALRETGKASTSKMGVIVSHLFSALLQSSTGKGWVLKPLTLPDLDGGDEWKLVRFVVVPQADYLGEQPKKTDN